MSSQRLSLSPRSALVFLLLLLLSPTSEAARDFPPSEAARKLPPRHQNDQGGYVVVIDAGSTGSRAHVFRWSLPPPGSPSQLLPSVAAAAPSLKREPGLSSTPPSEVAGALKPLLEHAARHVPEEHHASTDVLVLATAGLRSLPTTREREERLAAASDAVEALSPFPRPRRGAVATLRGEDEGALAWVAANAAAGSLVERNGAKKEDEAASTASDGAPVVPSTVGIAEVGGTSMQVTFEVSGGSDGGRGSPPPPSDVFVLELPSATPSSPAAYTLFSRSWEGLGHEAARATTAEASSSSSGSPDASPLDPCVPPGAVVPLPADVRASDSPPSTSGVGTGDFEACRSAASQALRLSCEARPRHCPLSTVANERPPPTLSGMEILGVENLRHTANALGLLEGSPKKRPTLREIVEAGKKLCSFGGGGGSGGGGGGNGSGGDVDDGERQQQEEKPPPFRVKNPAEAARHCFGAAYTVALLHDAFGVGLDERGVEFSGSVAVSSEKEKRETPEWTSAAAALAAATKSKGKKRPLPLPFESLLRPASDDSETSTSSSGLAGFLHRRREHRRHSLARLSLVCGAFAAAAVVVRSLASSSASASPTSRKRSSAPGDDSSSAAADALGSSGDGSSPVRGAKGGWKLSKRGGGGGSTKLDLSAESALASSAAEKAPSLLP